MTMATPAPSPTKLAVCEKPYIREKITHTALDIRPRIEQPQNQRSVFSAFPIPRPMEGVVIVGNRRPSLTRPQHWREPHRRYPARLRFHATDGRKTLGLHGCRRNWGRGTPLASKSSFDANEGEVPHVADLGGKVESGCNRLCNHTATPVWRTEEAEAVGVVTQRGLNNPRVIQLEADGVE